MPHEIIQQKTSTNLKAYTKMDNMDNILTKDIYIKKKYITGFIYFNKKCCSKNGPLSGFTKNILKFKQLRRGPFTLQIVHYIKWRKR